MFTASVLHRHRAALLSTAVFLIAVAWIGGRAIKDTLQNQETAKVMTGGDASRAPALIRRFGCAGCHDIPGVGGADGKVGGSLSDLRKRVYLGGVLNNNADNLVQWIVLPQKFSPRSAMPATGISEPEARDVAAYLYSR